jgi:hypothetical protein
MALTDVRDVLTYVHVREINPGSDWVDTGVSARTPAPGVKKALLSVRRRDGQLQKWAFTPGAMYWIAATGLEIRGTIDGPPSV